MKAISIKEYPTKFQPGMSLYLETEFVLIFEIIFFYNRLLFILTFSYILIYNSWCTCYTLWEFFYNLWVQIYISHLWIRKCLEVNWYCFQKIPRDMFSLHETCVHSNALSRTIEREREIELHIHSVHIA
jgi:hypothetical protein